MFILLYIGAQFAKIMLSWNMQYTLIWGQVKSEMLPSALQCTNKLPTISLVLDIQRAIVPRLFNLKM